VRSDVDRAGRAIDAVEWLAALWELTDPEPSRSANPHLLALLQWAPQLRAHPAVAACVRARATATRDHLIKAVVSAAYDADDTGSTIAVELARLVDEIDEVLGPGPCHVIARARDEARARISELAADLNPARDLAQLTGERIELRVVLGPSLFLPPPQAGRHGVLITRADTSVAHLHFGYPLRQDATQFGISHPWLLGGAWHYAIQLYLDRHWPPIAARLGERSHLGQAVRAAMAQVPGRSQASPSRARPWTDILATHLNLAMKCAMSRQQRLPDGVHRMLAKVQGFVLFPWIEEWLWDGVRRQIDFATHLATLPDALASDRPRWEQLAAAVAAARPSTVNYTLASVGARRARLVVPDGWSDDEITAAVAGWRLLSLPHVRYSEWARTRADAKPVIAIGEPHRNALVQRVLNERGLTLDAFAAADPAIVALSMPGFADADWCVAVAVTRPEAAAALRVEMILRRSYAYVVFDRGRMIDFAGRGTETRVSNPPAAAARY
jgi:hypothetical protein